ncbi:hypothetical protein FQA47_018734 [Oryzias melastigma]|uniref:Uncharacterized protein n=1 Tax=Oryzias melastigma TaxID=30732 RepID=A0A834FAF6_ORYME|nr:hypothetical protein FQA47_018734 [Oryzias melastigma]
MIQTGNLCRVLHTSSLQVSSVHDETTNQEAETRPASPLLVGQDPPKRTCTDNGVDVWTLQLHHDLKDLSISPAALLEELQTFCFQSAVLTFPNHSGFLSPSTLTHM